MSVKFYAVTVKRVLEETFSVEVDAESVEEAKKVALECALSDPPNHWRYHPKVHAVVKKVRRA